MHSLCQMLQSTHSANALVGLMLVVSRVDELPGLGMDLIASVLRPFHFRQKIVFHVVTSD